MTIGRNLDEYSKYLSLLNISNCKCSECGKVIWYPHTKAILKNNDSIVFYAANHETTKTIGNSVYNLSICYSCMLNRFPEISTKNTSKLFNTCNKYVKYAFKITDLDYDIQRKSHAITLKKLIKLYGEVEGAIKWKEYCEKQRITNTFEYKNNKYGMSKSEFIEYNKSRSCTLDNFINRHGEIEGRNKWEQYCKRQSFTNTKEYFIDKYGHKNGLFKYKELNSRKALTLDNYIKRLGLEIGTSEFMKYIQNSKLAYSKASQSLFEKLDSELRHLNLTTYYETKNKEFGKILKSFNRYCKIDYYIKELKLGIEYNGDYWHANPEIYNMDQIVHSNLTAGDIWDRDLSRMLALKYEHGIDIIVVWQNEDINNRNQILKNIINEVKSRI